MARLSVMAGCINFILKVAVVSLESAVFLGTTELELVSLRLLLDYGMTKNLR